MALSLAGFFARRVDSNRVPLVAAVLLIAAGAVAQDSEWQSGAPFSKSTGGSSATTATLNLVTGDTPGLFRIPDTTATISFRMMVLSGEREIPFTVKEATGQRSVFEGKGYSITISATDSQSVIAEFTTLEKARGIAYMVVSSSDGVTTPQLLQDFSGVELGLPGSDLYFQSVGSKTFRNIRRDKIELLAPMDPETRVRFSVSTVEKKPEQIRGAKVGAMKPEQIDERALATAR